MPRVVKNEDIYSRLGSLEGTLEQFIQEIRERRLEVAQDAAEIENRIRNLENWRSRVGGVVAGISMASSAITYAVSAYLHQKLGNPSI
jgi:hypothetical protein